jgi:hypothetical protein
MRWAKQWETCPIAFSLRWIGRILTVVALAMIGAFLFGPSGVHLFRLNQQETVLMAPFFVAAFGLLVAMRKEVLGGIITIAAVLGFYWVHHFISGSIPQGWAVPFIALPSVCLIAASYLGAYKRRHAHHRGNLPPGSQPTLPSLPHLPLVKHELQID